MTNLCRSQSHLALRGRLGRAQRHDVEDAGRPLLPEVVRGPAQNLAVLGAGRRLEVMIRHMTHLTGQ